MKRLAVVPLIALLAGCAPDEQPGLAITNVTVIDAIAGVRADQTVIVDGDRIEYVGPAGDAPVVADTVSGQGKYLIPGLWDMHVHLTYDDRITPVMPEAFLRHGVTSVRDTGGLLRKLGPVVEEFRSDAAMAPRVFFSGPLLDGQFVVYNGEAVPEIGTRNVDPGQAYQVVGELKDAGASFIKIYEMVSPEMFSALVDAAEEHGMPIASHVPLALRASQVGGSVDSMEHFRNIELDCASNWQELQTQRVEALRNEEGLPGIALRSSLHQAQRVPAIEAFDPGRCSEVMSTLKTVIQVPTAGLNAITMYPMWEREDWREALQVLPESVRNEWQNPPSWLPEDRSEWDLTFPEFTMAMIGRMHDAGVPIGAGTDTPIGLAVPGYSLLNELEILVTAGLSPMEALAAATVQPAAFFSILDQTGSVEVGKQADLVLLGANPLDDINNIRDIEMVLLKGTPVPR